MALNISSEKKLRDYNVTMKTLSSIVPRNHTFQLPNNGRLVKTVTLIAPSGAANRAVGSLSDYKKMKVENPALTTIDFRAKLYRPFF